MGGVRSIASWDHPLPTSPSERGRGLWCERRDLMKDANPGAADPRGDAGSDLVRLVREGYDRAASFSTPTAASGSLVEDRGEQNG